MAKAEKKAVMAAKLVLMKTVSTHGAFELRLHIPEEAAMEAIQKFGWPTMSTPVSVVIARLEESASLTQPLPKGVDSKLQALEDASKQLREEPPAPTRLRHWAEMTPAQQTGVIRNEPDFWDFAGVHNAIAARDYIRSWCGVKSCADIIPGFEAAAKWAQLQVRYGNWLRAARKQSA